VWCDGDAPLGGLKVRSGMEWDGDHSVFVLDQNHGREARPDRGWCNMGKIFDRL
jgi:hypothetical protein